MKLKLFALFLAVIVSSGVILAEHVYAYQYLYDVDTGTGEKITKDRAGGNFVYYYTFNSDNSKCYMTNENGVVKKTWSSTPIVYTYKGTKNGALIYHGYADYLRSGSKDVEGYIYFSPDYKRLNVPDSRDARIVMVLEEYQSDKFGAPSQMW